MTQPIKSQLDSLLLFIVFFLNSCFKINTIKKNRVKKYNKKNSQSRHYSDMRINMKENINRYKTYCQQNKKNILYLFFDS